ncbi:putative nuclease HARBI1 [Liolophura sinensis]|uniref:putative nuclease HARBI1 n=1 Tax=Liolophura sinensis TaxID=3198878 RepID=UPI00315885BC
MAELMIEDPQQLREFLRMRHGDFQVILDMIEAEITRKDTVMRKAIPAKERLALTLRFLATGDSYESLAYLFRIPANTISGIGPVVCKAIYKALKDGIKFPRSAVEWEVVAEAYKKLWHFPHCIGALDGKHVVLKAPAKSGSYFFNYKGTHSIVLLALVDAKYRFMFVDIGCNGRVSDGGVFSATQLFTGLKEKALSLPDPSPLPGRTKPVPYVVVADDAFALQENIMKPYPFRTRDIVSRVFNYRLSRARRMVESTFGILATRFRVLLKPINLNPDKAQLVVQAVVALHNFLMKEPNEAYTPPATTDLEDRDGNMMPGSWRADFNPQGTLLGLRHQGSNHHATSAREIQREFGEYFMTPIGEVSWQYQHA